MNTRQDEILRSLEHLSGALEKKQKDVQGQLIIGIVITVLTMIGMGITLHQIHSKTPHQGAVLERDMTEMRGIVREINVRLSKLEGRHPH